MQEWKAASTEDAAALSELAYCSEAFWGNGNEYMDQFRLFYNVTEEFIRENPVFILAENGRPAGFCGLKRAEEGWELEFFYIDVRLIGRGYGCRLWKLLLEECGRLEIGSFELVTSPEAEAFYLKMGAKTIGHLESLLQNGRIIPKLKYVL